VISDTEVVEAVLSGERSAFAVLVQRYEHAVCAAAMNVLHDGHMAEDAAQDAFVIAYEKLAALRDSSAFGTWILKIVRRQAIRLARRRSQRMPLDQTGNAGLQGSDGRMDEASEQLLAAVTRLPTHERRVLMLKHFDGHNV